MACCVVLMAFVAQVFAWRRKVWRLFGLPVENWDDGAEHTSFRQTWGSRFSRWSQSRATRYAISSVLVIEVAILGASAWGGANLITAHKEHVREFVSYITGHGAAVAPYCKGRPTATFPTDP
jgi:hypothetical protein